MSSSVSPQKRKTLFCIILFVAFCAFMTDVVDLREELQILSCPFGCPDNDFTNGTNNTAAVNYDSISVMFSGIESTAVKISFHHLSPCALRAPPTHS